MQKWYRFGLSVAAIFGWPLNVFGNTVKKENTELALAHLSLLDKHQTVLENMLIGVTIFVAAGAIIATFFGLKTLREVKDKLEVSFVDDINKKKEELTAEFKRYADEQTKKITSESQAKIDEKFDEHAEEVADVAKDELSGTATAVSKLGQEIDDLKTVIKDLQQRHEIAEQDQIMGIESEQAKRNETAWIAMSRELTSHKFVWRSIERLALAARISSVKAEEILEQKSDEVRMSVGKSGRRIARHVDRKPK